MRCVTYAGETVITTDDVAASLIELTAAVAKEGQAEAVSIPIVTDDKKVAQAELVIGVGNDVLSAPLEWHDEEPDFSHAAAELKDHRLFPRPHLRAVEPASTSDEEPFDYDFDQPTQA
ncbi:MULTISPECIES: hypothetical protein [Microbacterium]|uniref:hypothetical protein n=1 Tax=Microbacterium TaxID=33882 RepID=UPI000E39628E|nr:MULTISPECIES: hypothetical protein [Microbacterium]MDZ5143310.1 hypothetical protein [Microbacterium testaceum]REC99397.1 hypothetical protein DEU35_0371 [Microbacterium sp. AG157]WJS91882.1 hypothetical protein NYQ11_04820 [Microbacterium testaceum]